MNFKLFLNGSTEELIKVKKSRKKKVKELYEIDECLLD